MKGPVLIRLLWLADGGSFIRFILLCSGVTIAAFIPPRGTFSAQINREFMHRSLQRLPFFYHVVNNPVCATLFHLISSIFPSVLLLWCILGTPYNLSCSSLGCRVSCTLTKGSLKSPRAWPQPHSSPLPLHISLILLDFLHQPSKQHSWFTIQQLTSVLSRQFGPRPTKVMRKAPALPLPQKYSVCSLC